MLTWHQVGFEHQLRVDNIILVNVWQNVPLINFRRKPAKWYARTTFSGVGYQRFGAEYDSLEEAKAAMEEYINRVAKAILS